MKARSDDEELRDDDEEAEEEAEEEVEVDDDEEAEPPRGNRKVTDGTPIRVRKQRITGSSCSYTMTTSSTNRT